MEIRTLDPRNCVAMVFCSAGVSPAIFLTSTQRKNAGDTPALQEPAFHCESGQSEKDLVNYLSK
jgi:hypothetical protein